MHVTSLPGAEGIGTLGREAYAFADFLASAGMKIWQVLPVGPTGYGESPYQSASCYAGNPLLIDLQTLYEEGFAPRAPEAYTGDPETIDYEAVRAAKTAYLKEAFAYSRQKLNKDLSLFEAQTPWLSDFVLFMAIKEEACGVSWSRWPDEALRRREPSAMDAARARLQEQTGFHVFCQYFFFKQWSALKTYVNGKGLLLFGDMPIYIAEDSSDCWSEPELFQLDENLRPRRVAGVPPDYFSADGQRWGNPLYNWRAMRQTDYDWWVRRMDAAGRMFDILRVDHFIGFANYYSIPASERTARIGRWETGPGEKLFKTLKEALSNLDIVAEDLGVVGWRVKKLLKATRFPGMRVLTFAFGSDGENKNLPENYVKNCFAYTGTHDNDTLLGWWAAANEREKAEARATLGFTADDQVRDAFLNGLFGSVADTVVIPMQDALGLGNAARMNLPGTVGGNWLWRMPPGAATEPLANELLALNRKTQRSAQA